MLCPYEEKGTWPKRRVSTRYFVRFEPVRCAAKDFAGAGNRFLAVVAEEAAGPGLVAEEAAGEDFRLALKISFSRFHDLQGLSAVCRDA